MARRNYVGRVRYKFEGKPGLGAYAWILFYRVQTVDNEHSMQVIKGPSQVTGNVSSEVLDGGGEFAKLLWKSEWYCHLLAR